MQDIKWAWSRGATFEKGLIKGAGLEGDLLLRGIRFERALVETWRLKMRTARGLGKWNRTW